MKPTTSTHRGSRVPLQQEARALGDPTRYTMFRHIADASGPVDVAELTELLGLNHNAIRQHLAKLTEAGLVVETIVRGGGPGRPRLVYELGAGVESRWGVTGPYERLSLLLAEVIRSARPAVEVGRAAGRRAKGVPDPAGDEIDHVAEAMASQGFEPEVRRRGGRAEIVLHACPFATTALATPTRCAPCTSVSPRAPMRLSTTSCARTPAGLAASCSSTSSPRCDQPIDRQAATWGCWRGGGGPIPDPPESAVPWLPPPLPAARDK